MRRSSFATIETIDDLTTSHFIMTICDAKHGCRIFEKIGLKTESFSQVFGGYQVRKGQGKF